MCTTPIGECFVISEYDKGRTGVDAVQIMYEYSDTPSYSEPVVYDHVAGHGLVVTGQVVGSASTQANAVTTSQGTWSFSSEPFFLRDAVTISEATGIAFTGQSTKYFGNYGLSTYIYTKGFTMVNRAMRGFDRFEREEQTFLQMKEELLKNQAYSDKFVAILDGKLIDSDSDKAELAKRCYKRYGYIPIYFDKVERIKRIIRVPSPKRLQ